MNDQAVLSCRGLSREFKLGPQLVKVLNNINLSVNAGEKVAIVGASGSGKSTLLHCLGGLDEVNSGEVFLHDTNLIKLSNAKRASQRNRYMGFVYQFHHLLPEFTAVENVAMPLLIRGEKTSDALTQAKDMLKKVGLDHRLGHKPSELSGGERQRTAIARALVTQPDVVLADEPTGNLDSKTAGQIYDLIVDLNQSQKTSFVLVTHDSSLAQNMDRVLYLSDGELRED